MGSLNLEQKSSADEREAYKGTTSEETAIEKEQKRRNSENFNLKSQKIQKNQSENVRFAFDVFALFRLCLNKAAPFLILCQARELSRRVLLLQ